MINLSKLLTPILFLGAGVVNFAIFLYRAIFNNGFTPKLTIFMIACILLILFCLKEIQNVRKYNEGTTK